MKSINPKFLLGSFLAIAKRLRYFRGDRSNYLNKFQHGPTFLSETWPCPSAIAEHSL
ncbi:MAG: hypothetical protein VKJ64_16835 [Leptolyngbyaceae bacterium]|nr:hypothetical protein [Leptolyngbyaceae bacterium]